MKTPYEGPQVDVVAFGIIMFVALTQRPPFAETRPDDPHYRLLIGKREDIFWGAHAEADDGEDLYSKDFKSLFDGYVAFNPKERLTVDQIRAHSWIKGKMPSVGEIKKKSLTSASNWFKKLRKKKNAKDALNAITKKSGHCCMP